MKTAKELLYDISPAPGWQVGQPGFAEGQEVAKALQEWYAQFEK